MAISANITSRRYEMAEESDKGYPVFVVFLVLLILATALSTLAVSRFLTALSLEDKKAEECNACLDIWAQDNTTEFCSANCLCTTIRNQYYHIKLTDPTELNITVNDFNRLCTNNTDEDIKCDNIDDASGNITIFRQRLHLRYNLIKEQCVNVTVKTNEEN